MSSKPAQTNTKRNNPSHLFASGKAASQNRGLDSDTIAADIAAFKKRGGRVEVLGNTPFRANVTAFRSKGNTQRKTAASKPVSKTAEKTAG